MNVEIVVDETQEDIKVVLHTPAITDQVHQIVVSIQEVFEPVILCFDGETAIRLKPSSVMRIHTEGNKLLVVADQGVFQMKQRLYEVEMSLNPRHFVKISQSEIVNFARVERLNMSFKGTLMLRFDDGSQTYVSRRYMAKIKSHLGL